MDKIKPKIIWNWDLDLKFRYDKEIEIIFDDFRYNTIFNIRIIVIQEPYFITRWLKDAVMDRKNDNFYTYVFTWDQEVLDNNTKAIPFIGTNTWIHDYDFSPKKFSVSTLVGGKCIDGLEGHKLRQLLWNSKELINMPKDFYLSSHSQYTSADYSNNLVLGAYKEPMFNNQFHIAIENTSYKNMFSEKLIDCFQTKTIPIYYGCPNLGNTFNMDGVITVNNLNDIINVCNNLTPEYYNTKLVAIEENYEKSKQFCNSTDILDNKLFELFK